MFGSYISKDDFNQENDGDGSLKKLRAPRDATTSLENRSRNKDDLITTQSKKSFDKLSQKLRNERNKINSKPRKQVIRASKERNKFNKEWFHKNK